VKENQELRSDMFLLCMQWDTQEAMARTLHILEAQTE
jgi:hypothetical protein